MYIPLSRIARLIFFIRPGPSYMNPCTIEPSWHLHLFFPMHLLGVNSAYTNDRKDPLLLSERKRITSVDRSFKGFPLSPPDSALL